MLVVLRDKEVGEISSCLAVNKGVFPSEWHCGAYMEEGGLKAEGVQINLSKLLRQDAFYRRTDIPRHGSFEGVSATTGVCHLTGICSLISVMQFRLQS